MSGLREDLRRMVDGMPDGAAVTVPVDWIRERLGREPTEADEPLGDLTVKELAAELDRSESAVRDWLAAGEIPESYKFRNREWRIPRDAVRRFLEREASGDDGPPRRPEDADLGAWRDHLKEGVA